MNTLLNKPLPKSSSEPGKLSGSIELPILAVSTKPILKIEGKVVYKSATDLSEKIFDALKRKQFDFIDELSGEFLIFSQLGSQAVFIRDFLGTRPLYYSIQNKTFYYATRLSTLLSILPKQAEIDEEALGFYLLDCYAFQERTLYKNIYRLQAGNYLWIDRGKISVNSYRSSDYFLDLESESSKSSEEELEFLLEQAIKNRIEPDDNVGILLSGGIDSSAISKKTADILSNPSQNLHTYSLRFDDPECDPGPPLETVINLISSTHLDLFPEKNDEQLFISKDSLLSEVGYSPNLFMYTPALIKARDSGINAVFTGLGGDEVFWPGPLMIADMFKSGNLLSFGKTVLDIHSTGIPLHTIILRYLVRPLLPNQLMRIFRNYFPSKAPYWMNSEFAKRYNFGDQIFERFSAAKIKHPSFSVKSILFRLFGWGGLQWSLENEFEFFSSFGIYPSYPLLDKELIKLACRLPLKKLYFEGEGKRVLRDTMLSYFPKNICYSSRYIDYSNLVARTFKKQGSFNYLWKDSELVKRNLFTKKGIDSAFNQMYKEHNFQLFFRMLHAERLLRRVK